MHHATLSALPTAIAASVAIAAWIAASVAIAAWIAASVPVRDLLADLRRLR